MAAIQQQRCAAPAALAEAIISLTISASPLTVASPNSSAPTCVSARLEPMLVSGAQHFARVAVAARRAVVTAGIGRVDRAT